MLVTFTQAGAGAGMHARPMYTQGVDPATFDGDLWFFTDALSPKVEEIRADPRVLVVYADPGSSLYITVSGTATVEHNPERARELWNIHAKAWWPDGPESRDLALIHVRAGSAELWRGPGAASYTLSLLKAVVTGARPDLGGKHENLRLADSGGGSLPPST